MDGEQLRERSVHEGRKTLLNHYRSGNAQCSLLRPGLSPLMKEKKRVKRLRVLGLGELERGIWS